MCWLVKGRKKKRTTSRFRVIFAMRTKSLMMWD